MIGPRRIRAATVVLAVMGFAILFTSGDVARAADKEKEKLVGKWMSGKDVIPTTYEFTDKGAVIHTFGRETFRGTYKVKGSRVTLTFSRPRAKPVTRTLTIKKLDGDVLVIQEGPNELALTKKK